MSLSKILSYSCFLAVLIFSPLAFGTVETWSYAVMGVMIGACALFQVLSRRDEPYFVPPGLVPMLLIAGFLLLQIVPLPAGLVRLLSPEAWRIYHQTAGIVDGGGWMSLSVHPRATMLELTRFLSCLIFYLAAVQLLSDHVLLKRTLAVLAAFAAVLSLLVIIEFLTRQFNYPLPHDRIFWIRSSIHSGNSIGPYVNRNHYAGLMEMIFPLVTALFLIYRPGSSARGMKQKLRDILVTRRIGRHLLYGMAAVLIGTSVFVSLSRAGIFSLTVSMGMLSIWLALKVKNIKAGLVAVLLFVGIIVLTGSEAWDRIFERFGELRVESGELYHNRVQYWRDGLGIIGDFPLVGSGLGTWQDIYPLYRTIAGDGLLEHAHSDYVEFSATGGVVLVGLMALTLFRVVTVSFGAYQRRRERLGIYLFVASLAGVLSILLHSVVDFNLQVGANGLYFTLILALMVCAAHTRFHNSSRVSYLPRASIGRWLPRAVVAGFIVLIFFVQGGALLGNFFFFDYRNISRSADLSGRRLQAMYQASWQATATDPLNSLYHQAAAQAATMMNRSETARHHYQRAVRLKPLDTQALQNAGYFFFRQHESDIADPLMRAGIEFSHQDMGVYLNYAAALFEHDRTAEGLNVLKTAMSAFPGQADDCLALMVWRRIPESRMKAALPERVAPWLAFGDYLSSLGRFQEAADTYQHALNHAPREAALSRHHFFHVYRFFRARGDDDRALAVIKSALEYFPEDRQLNTLGRGAGLK